MTVSTSRSTLLGMAIILCLQCTSLGREPRVLRYDSPADAWTQALPVGNGRLGAMVFGGVSEARFQFNEDTLWTGAPANYVREGAATHLGSIRQLLFANKQGDAEALAMRVFMSEPVRQRAYQPCGDLRITFSPIAEENVKGYQRTLDLDSAIATTTFKIGDVHFQRQSFASHPANAVIVQLVADSKGALEFSAGFTTPHDIHQVAGGDQQSLQLTGRVRDVVDRYGFKSPGSIQFAAHVRILETDGIVTSDTTSLRVANASRATIALTAATNFVNYRDISANAVQRSWSHQRALTGSTFEQLAASHKQDHRALFRRVELRLDVADKDIEQHDRLLATDDRLLKYAKKQDPDLACLLFQYGRYLMIASSRPGSQPANLQGIWNDRLQPPWDSKYTTNINAEMNYWLAESCNLSECHDPLFDAIADLSSAGRETAKVHYGARGWVLHHNFDLWRGTAPINASDHGIWPCGGAWLCQHLWWRYCFTDDEEFLRSNAYPKMKAACEFFIDYLVENPNSPGQLISGPSNSPEHGGLVMGPTMDHQIVRGLFLNTAEAARTIGVDLEFADRLDELRKRIAPNQVGQHGQLQEWLEDDDDPESRHRHLSHLWGLHPGSEITPATPQLFEAARTSLEMRGDGGTGWSRAWKVNLWARLRDGDRALEILNGLMQLTQSPKTEYDGGGLYANLFDAHPPFQIDGNFGATAGICEMLVQSHRRLEDGSWLIEVLPALPKAWPHGMVKGLRARGGVTLDLHWRDGQLRKLRLSAAKDNEAATTFAYAGVKQRVSIAAGDAREFTFTD